MPSFTFNHHAMTEPTTTAAAAGTAAGYKLALLSLPIIASLIAFWLGIRFVPLRPGYAWNDLLNRVLGCLASSFIFGTIALVLLMQHKPGVFAAGAALAQLATFPPEAGFFVITGCVFVLCSIPGPWLVAAVFLWLERRKGRDIGEIAADIRADLGLPRIPANAATPTAPAAAVDTTIGKL
ncbi:hypothetical protein [Variovorax boronicumulans]|uniref:hypothetical protein n=1 Tax=Variovorax boronicumulans TaxID=436515 RepID=UPI001F0B5D33|nr:hypothetical protein [Variovorax boronicumulans]